MSLCLPGTPAPTGVPGSAGDASWPPWVGTSLVTDRGARIKFTGHQETDARTALSRALAEYVSQLAWLPPGGRLLRFEAVKAEWAEPEETAKYPSACAYAIGDQIYDPAGFIPKLVLGQPPSPELPSGTFLVHVSDITVDMRFEIYATDKEERMGLVAMLEAAFTPVTWMQGFRLDMPHYFGARSEFSMRKGAYDDTEEASVQRWRRATVSLEAKGPVMRLEQRAKATYKTDVRVVSEGAH